MINEKTLSNYDFDSIEDYFQYIVESRINGQHRQAKELFYALSEGMQGQRADFFEHIGEGNNFSLVDDWKNYLGIEIK